MLRVLHFRLRFPETSCGVRLFIENLSIAFGELGFVFYVGIPYDISIGNVERRAIVSTSRLETAVLKVCQNDSKEFGACSDLATSSAVKNER